MTRRNIHDIAQTISALPTSRRRGYVRVFGDWLGRPWDCQFTVSDCIANEMSLELTLENGIIVVVENPTAVKVSERGIVVEKAIRIVLSYPANRAEPGLPRETKQY